MITGLMRRECKILRRSPTGEVNDYGDEVLAEDEVDAVCELQQQRRLEAADMGEVSDATWIAYLPIGTDLRTGDALVVGGTAYEVIGEPWQADSGTAAVHHVEATLRLTAGQPR